MSEIENILIKYFGQISREGSGGNNAPTIINEVLVNKDYISKCISDIRKVLNSEIDKLEITNYGGETYIPASKVREAIERIFDE